MRAGQLVVATPLLGDPNFARTVVLLLRADATDGALGLVLNRPSGTGVDEVLPDWVQLTAGPAVLFTGGPVQPTAVICLGRKRIGAAPTASYAELEGVPGGSIGTVNLDSAPEQVGLAVAQVRIFAGYAGWSRGQLESEIEEGAWFVVDALPADAFDDRPDGLWRRVLRRQGPPVAFVASYPEDPSLN